MRKLFILALLALCGAAACATDATQNFDTTCGGANFRVTMTFTDTPGVRRFDLLFLPPNNGTPRGVYRGEEGGIFQAACMDSRKNGPVIVVRSHCRPNTQGCTVVNKFAVIEARSLEVILTPKRTNTPNDKVLAEILGYSVPNLSLSAGFFCCRD